MTSANAAVYESGALIWTNGATAGSSPVVTFTGISTTNGQTSLLWTIGSGTYQFTWTIYPSAPLGLTAVPGNNQVALTWNSVTGATTYNVKRAAVSGGPYSIIAGGITGTNYTDSVVTNGGTYYYVVSAVASLLEGVNSSEVAVALPFVPNFGFETPTISTYQYNPSGASWTFTPQSGNNGSGITANGSLFNSSNPNAPEGVQVAFLQSTSTISQAISGFVPGAKYTVTFSAAQRAGQFQHGGQTWSLKLDNSVIASYSAPATATSYVDYTTNFTASATTHTLSFVGTDLVGGDNTVFLDNVRIAPASSPFQAWQIQYFGSTNCAACGPDADFDGDGMSNTNEWLAGTNPTNSASVFQILSIVPQSNDIVITWQTVPGKTNFVQANSTDIAGPIVPVGTQTNYPDPMGLTNASPRLYRIRLVP